MRFMFNVTMIAATTPARAVSQSGALSSPIFARDAREHHKRDDREGELKAQDHLAEN
jgi:hypothetical protein